VAVVVKDNLAIELVERDFRTINHALSHPTRPEGLPARLPFQA
jgi:hypothetical protein